jgi:anti-sigma factor RsiW
MVKRAASKLRRRPTAKPHGHKTERCLRILRELSAFIDDELPGTLCRQIRRHLGDCPHCEDFVASLRQTVLLCRRNPAPALPADERARMRERILYAVQSR